MSIKWSILCAGVTERMPESASTLDNLIKQVEQYRDVEFIMLVDNCTMPLDQKRNALMSLARGEYVNFVDDDDGVPDDYVKLIRDSLEDVDYIGFKVAHFNQGKRTRPVIHSLKNDRWYEDDNGYYRNISHLNPIRKSLVNDIQFIGNMGEDADWSRRVYNSGRIKTEKFIDKEMYYYYADVEKSVAERNRSKQYE